MSDKPVTLAVVTGAHGVTGEVRLKLFTDDLAPYRSFNGGALTIKSLRGHIARFAEIADRNAAEALRGTELVVPRSALPALAEGEYYHADLIGLSCLVDNAEVGRCVAVDNFGAGDVVEVERPNGKRFMLPIFAVTIEPDRLILDSSFIEA
jgi:16S rRNA processing protein RimM